MDRSKISPPLFLFALFVSLGWSVSFSHAETPTVNPSSPSAHELRKPFATVGRVTISSETYINSLRQGIRQKFYHGKVPDSELAKFQREVGSQLVDKILLLKEAKRRGIKPDVADVAKTIAGYEKRYANSPRWRADRGKILPGLTTELETQSILTRLEKAVRSAVPSPRTAKVRAYYAAHPDKFTEPMDQKVSLILLKVASSSGGAVWDGARAEAKKLVGKLRKGADFGELAQIHSGDASAGDGGRLDYTHQGMLSEDVEKALAKIQPGEVTDPVMVLEGIGIFRLESRTPPRKVSFKMAKERAKGLLMRELSESTWAKFKKRLWKKGRVSINEREYYLPLVPSEEDSQKKGLQGKVATQRKTM